MEAQSEQLDFLNIKVATTDKTIKLTVKQVRVLCEAMWDFKTHIEEMPTGGTILEINKDFKINEIDELFNIIEKGSGYNFVKQLEKCSKKKADSDIGEDAMELLANGYKS